MIMLDLDGTLVALDPPRDDLERLRECLVDVADRAGVALPHRGIFRIYDRLYAVLGTDHAAVCSARAVLDEHESAWARTTARSLLDPAGAAALDRLAGAWTLVTNNGEACVRELVARGLLADTFAACVTRDTGLPLKPSPAPIRLALRGASGDGAWFVGDGDADEQAAAAAGVPVTFRRVVAGGVNEVLAGLTAGTPR